MKIKNNIIMNNTWIIVMSILGFVMIVNCICMCKICKRDYKYIMQLTASVYPNSQIPISTTEIPIPPIPQHNPTISIPSTVGTRVDNISENLHIIEIQTIINHEI